MGKILQFPVSPEARERLAAHDKIKNKRRETEDAIRRTGYILLAWSREMFVHEVIRGWCLPEESGRSVYSWSYDAKSMKECGGFHRTPPGEIYQWLLEDEKGLFKEFHICAPPYILLDSKELRREYLAGRMNAYGGLAADGSS
jgi:hypothetical protein